MGASLSRAIDRDQQRLHDHADQEGEACCTGGQRTTGSSRSTRSEMQLKPMAVLQQPPSRQAAGQQVGEVDQLLNLRSTTGVSTSGGSSGKPDQRGESRQCREGTRGAEDGVGGRPVAHGGDGARDDREGDGGHPDDTAPGGVPDNLASKSGEGDKGAETAELSNDFSRSWSQEFRRRGLCRPEDIPVPVDNKLGSSGADRAEPRLHQVSHGGGAGTDPSKDCRAARAADTADAAHLDRRGAGAGLQQEQPLDEHFQQLPLHVGKKALEFLQKINRDSQEALSHAVYDSKPIMWEVFCSPQSQLATSCEHQGFEVIRINLANDLDLYKADTYERIRDLARRKPPMRTWVSTPCTSFCDWSELNYNHRPEELNKKRRRERKMWRMLFPFLLELAMLPYNEIFWEWPFRCRGWREPLVEQFFEKLHDLGKDTFDCRIDGCRYNMKNSEGFLVKKSWNVRTTCASFYSEFRLKTCVGGHAHAWLQGEETTRSSYYPVNLTNSIARNWVKALFPERWWKQLWSAEASQVLDPFMELFGEEQMSSEAQEDADPVELQPDPAASSTEPSAQERQMWEAKLARLHRAGGHPTSRNMARMLRDAQLPRWKIQMALDYKCSACEESRLGSQSSKQVPPASTRPLPLAWEQVTMDVSEWEVPESPVKVKFLVMMDVATRFRMVETLFVYNYDKARSESTDDMIRVITLRWIMTKPRPKVLIPDNAKSFSSGRFSEFFGSIGISVVTPPDKESWAHGLAERSVGLVKEVANKLQRDSPAQDPSLTLALATSALNHTEVTKGYSAVQWAFGVQPSMQEDVEELRFQLGTPLDHDQGQFMRLLQRRSEAEEVARKARASSTLSKLANTSLRQPVRTFNMAQPVMVWRKFLPQTVFKGRRGGVKRTVRARWVGPGRVVFHELLPHQDDGDRRHVVWVILNGILYRCSVHSVRPLSEREQHVFEASGDDSRRWRELRDVIPKRNFVDVVHEAPEDSELEQPYLPDTPDTETIIPPRVRFQMKMPMQQGYPVLPPGDLPQVNEYQDVDGPSRPVDSLDETQETATDSTRSQHPIFRRSSTSSKTPLLGEPEQTVDAQEIEEPEAKRARVDDEDGLFLDFEEDNYVMTIDLDFTSNRQKKMFLHNPQAYLVKKVSSAEVQYGKLSPEDQELFKRAKNSEVSSFIRSEAVRRCLNWEEQQRAQNSDRVLRARWILVWKPVPPEDREAARQDAATNEKTVYTKAGDKKAKARIVVLGYQHPDLTSATFKSSAPVQSHLMRNLSLCLVAQRGWTLEGLDMSTAFLQTGSETVEGRELWTSGVPELREALSVGDKEVLRLLRNVYGNADAPRGLWADVDKTLSRLGGHRVVGDASFWVWTQPNPSPRNEADSHTVIGFVGMHVDDANRAGDLDNPSWLAVREQIDKSYKWGTVKSQTYRHTGVDLDVQEAGAERWVQLDQTFYAEALQDLSMNTERLRGDPKEKLTPSEMAACRASLGALQWLATQTQVQICGRVNLLLTELTVYQTVEVARELNGLIKEVRNNPVVLKLWRLPEAAHWQDFTVVTLADQAHGNRPEGGSTGGLMTFLGGPQHRRGQVGRLNLVAWRTWRLRRKAVSTNDGEIQSMLEGEDANYRTRYLWCQLNGCCAMVEGDMLDTANRMVRYLPGIVGTDSKGGYDAINKNEGPLLGLSNIRSPIQGFQLREQLGESHGKLIWLSGDWNLSDALTKKSMEARRGLQQYLKNWLWKLSFDPNFIQSEKKAKKLKQTATDQMKEFQALIPCIGQENFGLMR